MKKSSLPPAVTAVFLCLEALLYAAFLTLDLTGRGGHTTALKYSGILLCLLCALLRIRRGGSGLIFSALLCTAGADWFLLVRGDHLSVGLLLFLAVQTCYLLHLRRLGAGSAFPLRSALALLLGVLAVLFRLATPLNLLAALYFSQLLANTVLAWCAGAWRFAAGLTLFVCCDLCVGMFNLGLGGSFPAVGMWLFYLPSQVLIVLSAGEVRP